MVGFGERIPKMLPPRDGCFQTDDYLLLAIQLNTQV
jgi:hypothetical protein